MGRRGPKPIPTAEKIRRGNPGKGKLNREEPQPPPAASLGCPTWLKGDARRFWQDNAPLLEQSGVLTAVDLPKFEALCEAYHRWRQFERLCDRSSAELAIAKGYVNAALKQRQQFRQLSADFGMDPSSRTGIKANVPSAPKSAAEQAREKFFAIPG